MLMFCFRQWFCVNYLLCWFVWGWLTLEFDNTESEYLVVFCGTFLKIIVVFLWKVDGIWIQFVSWCLGINCKSEDVDVEWGGWNVLAGLHHFDCTFHLEWIRWGGKQTICSISVGLVSLMNSFYCTFPSWQMIGNQCSFFCFFLSLISPSISSFHSKSPHHFSFTAPSSCFFPIWLITS